jgi:molybdenum cofactor cytidylyltransferase
LIVAIVLAAGESARMGRPKQTLPIRGAPMLQAVLDVFRRTKVDQVVVVLGAHEQEVRESVRFGKEKVVVNALFGEGMSSSIRAGLSASPGADAAMIVPGDQPFLSPETIDRLIDAYIGSRSLVVVPVYHGQRGNPVLFDRSLFSQIMEIRGDVGAKEVVRANLGRLVEIAVEDRGVAADIDTPEDYSEAK